MSVRLGLAFGLTAAIAWLFRDFNFDDAYIVARYAANIAAGAGWVFNRDEHYNGATSMLFTVAVAALARVGFEPIWAAHWLAVALLAVAVWQTGEWLVDHNFRLGGVVVIGLMATAPLLHLTVGLETTLYLALLAICLRLLRRPRWLGVALGLLILTRGDGVLALGVIAAYLLLNRRRGTSWRAGFIDASIVTTVATTVVIGSLGVAVATLNWTPPGTLAAKLAHVESGLWHERPGNLFLDWLAIWLRIFLGPPWPVYPFVAVGLGMLLRRRSVVLLGPLIVAAYVAAYAGLGIVTYHWYMAPIWWATAVFAGCGVETIARWWRPAPRWSRAWGVAAVAAAIALNAPALQTAVIRETRDPRDVAYTAVGVWLRNRVTKVETDAPPPRVAAVEVGTIAYTSGLAGLDPLGLVSPDMAPRLASGDVLWWLQRWQPSHVVLHEPLVLFEAEVRLAPEFAYAYRPVHTIDTDHYRYRLTIYERLDASEFRVWQDRRRGDNASTTPRRWSFDAGACLGGSPCPTWQPNADLQARSSGRPGHFTAAGDDPQLISPAIVAPVGEVAGVAFRLRARVDSGALATTGELYWAGAGTVGFSPERNIAFPVRSDGRWREYRLALDLGADPAHNLDRLRLDPLPETGEVEIDAIELLNPGQVGVCGSIGARC